MTTFRVEIYSEEKIVYFPVNSKHLNLYHLNCLANQIIITIDVAKINSIFCFKHRNQLQNLKKNVFHQKLLLKSLNRKRVCPFQT